MKKILIILILVSYSCSNKELSRELAKEKISVYFNMPCVETVNFQNMSLGKNIIPPKYNEMISNDLLTFDREKSWNTLYFLTRKSLPYYNKDKKKFAGNLAEIKEITGIKFNENKTIATVYFTIIRKEITPFGLLEKRSESEIVEKNINLELFDDGWRVIKTDLEEKFLSKSLFDFCNEEFMKKLNEEIEQENEWMEAEAINSEN